MSYFSPKKKIMARIVIVCKDLFLYAIPLILILYPFDSYNDSDREKGEMMIITIHILKRKKQKTI